VLLAGFIAILWLAVEALRRRVGISVLPAVASARGRLAVLLGVGMGAVAAFAERLQTLATSGIPMPPTTTSSEVVPGLSALLSAAIAPITAVPGIAIPLLVIAGLTSRTRYRVMLVVVVVAFIAATILPALQAATAGSASTPASVTAGILGVAMFAYAIRAWGSAGVVAWLCASLTERGLSALYHVVHAGDIVEGVLAVLILVVCALPLCYVARSLNGTTTSRESTLQTT
jgi:hypothetical protein